LVPVRVVAAQAPIVHRSGLAVAVVGPAQKRRLEKQAVR
jgi:hypothetical protein